MSIPLGSSGKINLDERGAWALIKNQISNSKRVIKEQDSIGRYYNLLVRAVRESRWDQFSKNLDIMKTGDIPFTATDLTNIIDVCGSYDKSQQCLKLVDAAIVSIGHFTQILSYCKKPQEGKKVYKQVITRRLHLDSEFVARLLFLFKKSTSMLDLGESIVKNLREKCKVVCDCSVYVSLYQLFSRCRGEEKKLDLYDSWITEDKVPKDARLVTQQIFACSLTRSGQERAEAYFKSYDKEPTIEVLNALISVYVSSKNGIEPIQRILFTMKAKGVAPSEVTYQHWIRALGNSSRNESIKKNFSLFFEEHGFGGKSITSHKLVKNVPWTPQKYENFESRNREDVDKFAARNLMVALSKSPSLDDAVKLLKRHIASHGTDAVDPGHFSKLLHRATNYTRAVQLYNMMIDNKVKPDGVVYDMLIRKAVKEDKIDEAEKWCNFIDQLPKDLRDKRMSYVAVLIEYYGINKKDILKAEALFDLDTNPCSVVLSSMIKVYKGINNLKRAEDLVFKMRSRGICDVFVYTSLFDLCAISNGGMERLKQYEIWMNEDKVLPNTATVTCKIRCCIPTTEGFKKAEALFNSISLESREIRVYNAYLNLYADATDQWEKALSVFNQTKIEERTVETYGVLLKACANNNLKEDVVEKYIKEINPLLINDSFVAALIRTCISSGNYTKAEEYYLLLKGQKPSGLTFMALISVCRKGVERVKSDLEEVARIKERAKKYYKQAVDLGLGDSVGLVQNYLELSPEDPLLLRQVKGAPTTATYNVLIKNSKSLPDALRLKREMESKGLLLTEETYSILINQCAVCGGDIVQADRLYQELVFRKIVPNDVIVGALIKVCVNAGGAIQKALSYFQILVNSGLSPNVIIFNTLLNVCAAASDLPMADKVLRLMDEYRVERDINSYNVLLKVCSSDKGNRDRAISEFDNIKYPLHPGIETFTAMINVVASEGKNFADAKMYFELMTKTRRSPNSKEYIIPDATAITSMIACCTSCSEPEKTVNEYWGKFETDAIAKDAIAYGAIIRYYSERGDYAKTKTYFMEGISKFPLSYELFHSLISAAIRTKQKYSEIVWVREMMAKQNLLPRLTTYNRLLRYHSMFSNRKRVKLILEEMRTSGFNPNLATYHIQLCRAKSLHHVDSTLQEMSECNLETTVYIDEIVKRHVKSITPSLSEDKAITSDEEMALALIKIMQREGYNAIGEWLFNGIKPAPSTHACNTFLELYASHPKQLQKVEKIFSKITNPDVLSFNLLFTSCSNSNCSIETVEKHIEEMITSVPVDEVYSPIVSVYNGIIKRCTTAQDIIAVRNSIKSKGVKPNVESYQLLFASCIRCGGDSMLANKLYQEMTSFKIAPTREIFNTLVEVCVKAGGDIKKALFYCNKMIQQNILPDTVMCQRLLYLCLVAGGDCENAEKILELMQTHKISLTSQAIAILHSIMEFYTGAMNSYKVESWPELMRVVQRPESITAVTKMIEETESIELSAKQISKKDSLSDPVNFTLILESILSTNRGSINKLREQLAMFKDVDISSNAIRNGCKIRYLASINAYSQAKACFHQALLKYPANHELFHSLIIAAALAKVKDDDIDMIERDIETSGLYAHLSTFNWLLSYYLSQGDLKRAEAIIKKIDQRGLSPNLTTYYIQLLAAVDLIEVNRLLTEMSDRGLSITLSMKMIVKDHITEEMKNRSVDSLPRDRQDVINSIQRYCNKELTAVAEVLFFSIQKITSIPHEAERFMKEYLRSGNRKKFVQFASLSEERADLLTVYHEDTCAHITFQHSESKKMHTLAQLLKYKKTHASYYIKAEEPALTSEWYQNNLNRFGSARKVIVMKDHFTC